VKLLLDTHTFIWAVDQPLLLGPSAKTALEDLANNLMLSAATIWEIAIKIGVKKLTLSLPYRQWMTRATNDLGVTVLPVTVEYADVQAELPQHHRDPFDRLLVAQAIVENVPLVSNDTIFDQYGVARVW
jgi:PIN domain nuclease of toxin-antitoxin system